MSKYVVVDLEMCRVKKGQAPKGMRYGYELIEIGAVLLDEGYNEIDSFKTYVSPQYGEIDRYIEKLTGITRKDTQNAPSTGEAIEAFVKWMPEDAIPVSWSENDKKQILKEIECKSLDIQGLTEYLDRWEDCQKTFSEKIGATRSYNLSEAMNLADILYDENIHDGLIDSRNTAMLLKKMMTEEEMKLNPYYMAMCDDATVGGIGLLGNYSYAV